MAETSTFTLSPTTIQQLTEISRAEEKPRSLLIREWIAEKHHIMKETAKEKLSEE